MIKLYLSDNTLPEISLYLKEEACKLNPEVHRRMEDRFGKVINRVLTKSLGRGWKKVVADPRIKNSIPHYPCIYFIPNNFLERDLPKWIPRDYGTIKLYPLFSSLIMEEIMEEEHQSLSEILSEILDIRMKVAQDLVDRKILRPSNGTPAVKTLGEIKERCPNLFEWHVKSILGREGVDQVRVISVEEDLENLKRWIPGVMI